MVFLIEPSSTIVTTTVSSPFSTTLIMQQGDEQQGSHNNSNNNINKTTKSSLLNEKNNNMFGVVVSSPGNTIISNNNNNDPTSFPSLQQHPQLSPHHFPRSRPTRESVLKRLSEALLRRSLTKIDLSQRGLMPSDARLVKMALLQNRQLTVLKLGYNNLGDTGVTILADGLLRPLESLDLGFNNVGDVGCAALCRAIPAESRLNTLYLAGNLIGEEGAMALADLIRRGVNLRKLYLTGNFLGSEGVKAIIEAVIEDEERRRSNDDFELLMAEDFEEKKSASIHQKRRHKKSYDNNKNSVEELYLGGTGMGPRGCEAIARLLQRTQQIRVISLPNCEINDDSVILLAGSIRSNRDSLPLESLQLSFNKITCKGIESLANALWGINTLKELLLDNNEISDRGIQHISAVLLPRVKTLETLNVGFNLIKTHGIKLLMKAVADYNSSLQSLSISGNAIDTSAAKSISHALAYDRSLVSLSLVHCQIAYEGQRHIAAGIISNSRITLQELAGFRLGPVVVSLGFPSAIEHWTNGQILKFVHHMWEQHRMENTSPQRNEDVMANDTSLEEEEKLMDPLNFLDDANNNTRTAPQDATIVVEVAKKAYTSLIANGMDTIFIKRNGELNEFSDASPIVSDGIILESNSSQMQSLQEQINIRYTDRRNSTPMGDSQHGASMPTRKINSFVSTPEATKPGRPDPERKKRVMEWLNSNIKQIHALSDRPFNAGELWRLHQHYFTPVVNESGGESVVPSPNASIGSVGLTISSVPEVSRTSSCNQGDDSTSFSVGDNVLCASSHPKMKASSSNLSSLPLLKRKVSYRFLAEAAFTSADAVERPRIPVAQSTPVSRMIEGAPGLHSLPPKTKRARRNRSRISFMPRVKAKLDSYLDTCHEKALVTMRQLYYVEQALLGGSVNTIDPLTPRTHLSGDLASDAELIIVDLI